MYLSKNVKMQHLFYSISYILDDIKNFLRFICDVHFLNITSGQKVVDRNCEVLYETSE